MKKITPSDKHIDDFADDGLGMMRGIVNVVKPTLKYGPLALLITGSAVCGARGYGMPSALLGFYASVFYAGFFCNPELNFSNEEELGLDHKKHGLTEAHYESAQRIFIKLTK